MASRFSGWVRKTGTVHALRSFLTSLGTVPVLLGSLGVFECVPRVRFVNGYVNSRPRMVPVEDAKASASIPIC